jgi:serine/threonine protein kinase
VLFLVFEYDRALRRARSCYLSLIPFAGRSLLHRKHGPSARVSVRFFCLSVVQVLFLDSLHSKGYIFRNIKPESLLIDSEG